MGILHSRERPLDSRERPLDIRKRRGVVGRVGLVNVINKLRLIKKMFLDRVNPPPPRRFRISSGRSRLSNGRSRISGSPMARRRRQAMGTPNNWERHNTKWERHHIKWKRRGGVGWGGRDLFLSVTFHFVLYPQQYLDDPAPYP